MNFQIRTASLARSVLCFGYQECESNFPQEPLGRKKAKTTRVYNFENDLELSSRAESREDDLRVYPNPTNEQFTVELQNFDTEINYSIVIHSMEGKKLQESKIVASKTVLSANKLSKGSYLVMLYKNGELGGETVLVKN